MSTSLILTILAILALALFFGWLAIRAWRARRPIVKWTAVILAGSAIAILAYQLDLTFSTQ